MFKAVVWVHAEVHEVNQHDELSGDPIHKHVDLLPIVVEEETHQKCIDKLKDVIDGMRRICQS